MIGPAPARGSSERCQSEAAARKTEPLSGSGSRLQCFPGAAPHSLSLRGGTASSNPSSSSGESANFRFLAGTIPRTAIAGIADAEQRQRRRGALAIGVALLMMGGILTTYIFYHRAIMQQQCPPSALARQTG